MTTGAKLVRSYQGVLLCYLTSVLFLYPYGLPVADEATLRVPDLFALLALVIGCGAILLRGRIKIDRVLLAVVGPFLLLELVMPVIGAVGYRRPIDVVSSLRIAMLWLPIVFLTMLAPPWGALRLEKSLTRLLAIVLWLNLAYALMQIAATVGWIPQSLLITAHLEPWTVDRNFNVIQGLRPAGFFNNSTALSVFGVVSLCFFYSRYVSHPTPRDLLYSLLSIGIVTLTTSRTAYAAAAVIVFAGWWHLPKGDRLTVAAILLAGVSAILLVVENTVGVEAAFYRFQRLAESGLLEDQSFGTRLYQSWPTAIHAAQDYVFGTLVQAPRALPVIDSGYLTYYLQGKWPFVAALAILLGGLWILGARAYFGARNKRFGTMILFVAIYLTGALVISNPLRSPLMIFIIVFCLWRMRVERTGRRFRILNPEAVQVPRMSLGVA